MNIIAVISARGGSKGIPRKNLRPMAGKPLITYSINACLKAESVSKVIVTTDDEEIALIASRFGAEVLMRPTSLADDKTTLDPVIAHAVENAGKPELGEWDIVLTVQPTSPLLTSNDIDQAMERFNDQDCDTVISVVDDRHLCWIIRNGKTVPAYQTRVNRQELPIRFKETGAIISCRMKVLEEGSRIGNSIALHEVEHETSFDIDSISDFYLCESLLQRKKIVFFVGGSSSVGMGHAYRAVMLANELVRNQIVFVVTDEDDLAEAYIAKHNYQVLCVPAKKVLQTITSLQPDLVINDILDTDEKYIKMLKASEIKVVNFEDMGPGINHADLVINALYPTKFPLSHVYNGADYFCLRDEFLYIDVPIPQKRVENVLLCFGGVDEGNLSCLVLAAIAPICKERNIGVTIVLGLGYSLQDKLDRLIETVALSNLEIIKGTSRMSDYMANADLAVTSGGRTVFELAALSVPTLVICQNERELTHKFASSENGVVNMGHRDSVDEEQIKATFSSVLLNKDMRDLMLEKANALDLTKGKKRVIDLIERLMEN